MSDLVVYEGSDEWSALYQKGKLVLVGDHYLVDEWLKSHFQVEVRQSNDFMQGGTLRETVARTLQEAEEFGTSHEEALKKAKALEEKAQHLLTEANVFKLRDGLWHIACEWPGCYGLESFKQWQEAYTLAYWHIRKEHDPEKPWLRKWGCHWGK